MMRATTFTIAAIALVLACRAVAWRRRVLLLMIEINQLKYGRSCAYFLSPIPLTFFKSSALLNGRAAMIRAAITGPIPGINLSSFSVAVLMSNLAGNNLSFLLVLGDEADGGAAFGMVREGLGIVAGDALGAFDCSIFAAQPPSLVCFA